MTDDLLALLVEVTSVGVAGRQIKKPLEIPRPEKKKPKPVGRNAKDAAFKSGISMLANTAKTVKK